MSMTLIQHTELASAQATITFSSIPQTFTDLYLVVSARSNFSGVVADVRIQLNNATSNFSIKRLFGDGSGRASDAPSLDMVISNANTSTSSTFSNISAYIPNYASSNTKSISADFVTENNATTAYQGISSILWNQTTAVSSIVLDYNAGDFVQFSSATLYGITAGTTPGVVVS